jgi:hypothetical protein
MPTARLTVVLVALACMLASPGIVTATDEQACGQSPGNRYF